MFQYLGITDEVSVCDCCGKSDLKCTVAFDHDGAVVYYGTTCAARNTNKPVKEWQSEADKAARAREADALIEYRQSIECRQLNKRFALRQAQMTVIGRESADFVREVCDAATVKMKEIAARHNVRTFGIMQFPMH